MTTNKQRTVRVPSELALALLRSSGYTVRAGTLRQWVRRGHITRTAQGYDLYEIRDYLEKREILEQTPD